MSPSHKRRKTTTPKPRNLGPYQDVDEEDEFFDDPFTDPDDLPATDAPVVVGVPVRAFPPPIGPELYDPAELMKWVKAREKANAPLPPPPPASETGESL